MKQLKHTDYFFNFISIFPQISLLLHFFQLRSQILIKGKLLFNLAVLLDKAGTKWHLMSMKCPIYLNFTKIATKKSSSYLSCCIKFEKTLKTKEKKMIGKQSSFNYIYKTLPKYFKIKKAITYVFLKEF